MWEPVKNNTIKYSRTSSADTKPFHISPISNIEFESYLNPSDSYLLLLLDHILEFS